MRTAIRWYRAGMPGLFAEVRDGDQVWRGAAGVAGVADIATGRPVTADMRHRVGSDMSWVGPSASLISTVTDLNRFFGMLPAGEIVGPSSLAQMRRTVPVVSQEGKTIDYGLGLHPMDGPGQGTFWGHGGTVWGGGAPAMTRADGKRQMSVAVNLQRWNRLDASGRPQPHPIDDALSTLYRVAMSG
ncbi:serine hydrolase [Streptomyces sp. CBMA156]|uniref:serine hydrolase n=1 Tax=Streptomyces sp. CBMA156 TaxID=1930280 RepID=UPI001661DB53|nr:serine hydrolase [Streptomyces sp. CBMA156]MBD0675291.1 hypothetical protein [Streptomyces sp. CBMA156]